MSPHSRRWFLQAAAAAGASVAAARVAAGEARNLRAVVLEHRDRWTNLTGLARLLAEAGFDVAPLDLGVPATAQPTAPDLVAFGSFTNNADEYADYVAAHTISLQRFVNNGGVVLEMTQSDQFGASIDYLPRDLSARRGDEDLGRVYGIDRDHPLVGPWFPAGEDWLDASALGIPRLNWESFERWTQLRVLLASTPNGQLPCLLEGGYARGRFVLSSLYLDKCFDADGLPAQPPAVLELARGFFAAVAGYVAAVRAGTLGPVRPTPMPPEPMAGPMIGHVDDRSAQLWCRPPSDLLDDTLWTCVVTAGRTRRIATTRPDRDHDFTLRFRVEGLPADTECEAIVYRSPAGGVDPASTAAAAGFRTAPAPATPSRVVLGLGSCAPSAPDAVWTRIVDEGCEGFVFLGDTPYIDSTDLEIAREKHRRFLVQPEIARMIAAMPCWGTWDDHDFGGNDVHGDFSAKATLRRAFTEYRANATFGHGPDGLPQPDPFGEGAGIYTSFRRGPLEVFLIDPRWFSRTEQSWADRSKTTCIGAEQWEWLREGLRSSDATFKALATGIIWDDKQNSESDDWHTYRHERDAIFDFIRDERIEGCFLIGGDIHVSRALRYPGRVGYDLWQFIVSPLHDRVIPSLNVPHPNLVHDAVEPNVFLRLDADTAAPDPGLDARWINRAGDLVFSVQLSADQLRT